MAQIRIALVLLLIFSSAYRSAYAHDDTHGATTATPAALAPHALILDVLELSTGRLIAVGERGHLLLSDDSGSTWRQVLTPVASMLTAISSAGSHVWVVGHDTTILHSPDYGETWEVQVYEPERETPLFDVYFHNSKRGLAVGAYALALHTEDGGQTWSEIITDEDDEPHWYKIVPAAQSGFFLIGEFGSIFQSPNLSGPWQQRDSPYEGTLFGGLLYDSLPSSTPTLLIYGLRGNVFLTPLQEEFAWQRIVTGDERSILDAQHCQHDLILVGLGGAFVRSGVAQSHELAQAFSVETLLGRQAIGGVHCLSGGQGIVLSGEFGVIRQALPPTVTAEFQGSH